MALHAAAVDVSKGKHISTRVRAPQQGDRCLDLQQIDVQGCGLAV